MPRSNRHRFRPQNIPCTFHGCARLFSDQSGLKRHVKCAHPSFTGTRLGAGPQHSAPPSSSTGAPFPSGSQSVPPYDAGGHSFDAPDAPESTRNGQPEGEPSTPATNQARVEFHPSLNGTCEFRRFLELLLTFETPPLLTLVARRCNKDGEFLPDDAPPPPSHDRASTDFSPFESRIQFEVADFLYRRAQMSAKKINELMQLWAATLDEDREPPFAGSAHLQETIDEIVNGDVTWEQFSVRWKGSVAPTTPLLSWQVREYTVLFRDPRLVLRNQLGNPDFARDIDFVPKRVYGPNGKRVYKDFMSGDWVWEQAVSVTCSCYSSVVNAIICQNKLAANPRNHGAAFCATAIGSDKTTVSVATGQNEYYPLYLTNGNVTNSMRRAHRNAITLIGFLAIPKSEYKYVGTKRIRDI